MKNGFVEEDKSLSDNELVDFINQGRFEYLQILINRYMPLVLKIATKYRNVVFDVDNLVQEGILAIFSAVKTYEGDKASFSTFVEICVSRAIGTLVKSQTASKRIPDKFISPLNDFELQTNSTPEDIIINRESYKDLTDNIRINLSDLEYRVLCAFVEGKSYLEISNAVGISSKSVDNALKRIRQKLKSI